MQPDHDERNPADRPAPATAVGHTGRAEPVAAAEGETR